jgi:prepilin-type N-terminal cleavage/methylation domain-containing protein
MSLFFWVKEWGLLAETINTMRVRIKQGGFTLIEAMLAIVVLSIAAAGVLLPFAGGATVQADGIHRTMAAKLAGDLLEQIASKPFSTISSYNGYTETQGQIKNVSGNVFTDPAYSKFSRSVSCSYVYTAQQAGTLPSVFILVTVKVSYEGGQLISLTRLVSQ